MSAGTGPGTCTWEFDGTNWTLISSDCNPGFNCAETASAAGSTKSLTVGTTVSDADFRKRLNAARILKSGSPLDVIPANLALQKGSTYKMDCV